MREMLLYRFSCCEHNSETNTNDSGWNSPCMPDQDGYFEKCAGCAKSFNNKICFQRHVNTDICSLFKRCEKLGLNYKIEQKKEDARGPRPIDHRCNRLVIKNRVKFCLIKVFKVL